MVEQLPEPRDCELAPSLLRLDFRNLDAALSPIIPSADRLHLDICDGRFCPALTYGPDVVRAVADISGLPLNLHLGMVRPDEWFERFALAGATWLSFHPGTVPDPHLAIDAVRRTGARPGIALLPDEDPARYAALYPDVEVVISLAVWPGVQAQPTVVDPVVRTAQVASAVRDAGSNAVVEVDGGVTLELVAPLVAAGAGALSVGSRIFAADDPGTAARRFREHLDVALASATSDTKGPR
jgi:ribulose-phosphate 3-epimerase